MSFVRRGTKACGRGIENAPATLPSFSTVKTLMLPLTFAKKMREPSGEKIKSGVADLSFLVRLENVRRYDVRLGFVGFVRRQGDLLEQSFP
jgi:hypothetical protein